MKGEWKRGLQIRIKILCFGPANSFCGAYHILNLEKEEKNFDGMRHPGNSEVLGFTASSYHTAIS